MPKKRKPKAPSDPDVSLRDANRLKRVALTCRFFQDLSPPGVIADKLREEHEIKVTRETPYMDLLHAIRIGYLEFKPPHVENVARKLKRLTRCENVNFLVVETDSRKDVATAAAATVHSQIEQILVGERVTERQLKIWLKEFSVSNGKIVVPVRIGFSGGRTMSQLADRLGILLRRDVEEFDDELRAAVRSKCHELGYDLPAEFLERFSVKFVLHNLVTGFDYEDPSTHPVAFLFEMVANNGLLDGGRCEFSCFNAAPFAPIDRDLYKLLLDAPGVQEAANAAQKLDIIVSSGGSFEDEQSALRRFYGKPHIGSVAKSKWARKFFRDHGCHGDFLGQPITDDGPFDLVAALQKGEKDPPIHYRPVTAIDVHDIPRFIKERHVKVILALGPSKLTDGSLHYKDQIFKSILNHPQQMLTHAVADLTTTRRAINWFEEQRA